jgi:ABC-type Na+ efflux pump permease subunit
MQELFKYYQLTITDLKLITRDRSLLMFLIIPLLILAVLRWAIPYISSYYPDFISYYPLIVGMMAIVISVFPGFIMAFIIIEEKEENILNVFKILPVRYSWFIYGRVFIIACMAFIYSFIVLQYSGLVQFELGLILKASVLNAFIGPVSALFILSEVRNKIEGMTYMKGMNFLWLIPVVHFFIDSRWKYIFAIIPDYWTLQIIYHPEHSSFSFFAGLFLHIVCILWVGRMFIKRASNA